MHHMEIPDHHNRTLKMKLTELRRSRENIDLNHKVVGLSFSTKTTATNVNL